MSSQLAVPASNAGFKLRTKMCATSEQNCVLERTYYRISFDSTTIADPKSNNRTIFSIESKANKIREKKILRGPDGTAILNSKRSLLNWTIHAGDHSESLISKVSFAPMPKGVRISTQFTDKLTGAKRNVVIKNAVEESGWKEKGEFIAFLREEEPGKEVRKTQLARLYKRPMGRDEMEICAGVDSALIAILSILIREVANKPQQMYVNGLVPHG